MEMIISTISLDQRLQILLMDGLFMVYGNKTKTGKKMCAVIGMGLIMGIVLRQLKLLLIQRDELGLILETVILLELFMPSWMEML